MATSTLCTLLTFRPSRRDIAVPKGVFSSPPESFLRELGSTETFLEVVFSSHPQKSFCTPQNFWKPVLRLLPYIESNHAKSTRIYMKSFWCLEGADIFLGPPELSKNTNHTSWVVVVTCRISATPHEHGFQSESCTANLTISQCALDS